MRKLTFILIIILCGINVSSTIGQIIATPLEPLDLTITSDSKQLISIYLNSTTSLTANKIKVTVQGIQYTASRLTNKPLVLVDEGVNGRLTFNPDKTTPAITFSDGETVIYSIDEAQNGAGNTLANPQTLSFVVDLDSPVFSDTYPVSGSFINSEVFNSISVKINDFTGRINPEELKFLLRINGIGEDTLNLSNVNLSWNDSILSYAMNPSIEIYDGDSLEVWVYARDTIDYGFYHYSETTWGFEISNSGPEVEIISPLNNTTSSDTLKSIYMRITDVNGLDLSSLKFVFMDSIYKIDSDLIIFSGDTLKFTPDTAYSDGDTLTFSLDSINDIYDNPMNDTLIIKYIIDLSGPDTLNVYPGPDTTVFDIQQDIKLDLFDLLSEINSDSIVLTVESVKYKTGSPGFYLEGSTLIFKPEDAYPPLWFKDHDTIEVAIDVYDIVDYGEPNQINTTNWFFKVDSLGGPFVREVIPYLNSITSSNNQRIDINFNEGITKPEVVLTLNNTIYYGNIHSEYFEISSFLDTLYFYPEKAGILFSDGELVKVSIDNAISNESGMSLQNPKAWTFMVDLRPPSFSNVFPEPASSIALNSFDSISVCISDSLSSVNPDSLWFRLAINNAIQGDMLNLDSPKLHWSDSTFYYLYDSNEFEDGDTIQVWVSACDSVSYGNTNRDTFTWTFIINDSAPAISLLTPPSNAISGDQLQKIILTLTDNNGISTSSIRLRINSSNYPDNIYSIPANTEMVFINDSLIFTPVTPFINGDVVTFFLDSLADATGITASDTSWFWYTDLEDPLIRGFYPPAGADVKISDLDSISAVISDGPFGKINQDSIWFKLRVNGRDSTDLRFIDNNLLKLVNDTLLIYNYSKESSIIISDGDTVEVKACVSDSAQFSPNRTISDWLFIINEKGPVITSIIPADNTITSDSLQKVRIVLHDKNGIDPASIQLVINSTNRPSDILTIGSPELWLTGDTLIFSPTTPFDKKDTITFSLESITDVFGSIGQDTIWHLFVDAKIPEVTNHWPGQNTNVFTSDMDSVSVVITKQIGFIKPQNVKFRIIANERDSSELISVDNNLLKLIRDSILVYNYTLDPSITIMDGDTLQARVSVYDSTNYSPTVTEFSWTFYINDNIPEISLAEPIDSSYTSDSYQASRLRIFDNNGIDNSSIRIIVNRTNYPPETLAFSDPGFTFENDTLVYTPQIPYINGDTVIFTLDSVTDNFNTSGMEMTWQFYVDIESPVAELVYPVTDTIFYAYEILRIQLTDTLSEIDPESIVLSIMDSTFVVGDPGITWNDTVLSFNPVNALPPVAYNDGSILSVTLSALDRIDYGIPNILATGNQWSYFICLDGPVSSLLAPQDSIITSNSYQKISILLNDKNGIDPASIRFYVNSENYPDSFFSLDDEELSYHNDTLIFEPKTPFVTHERVSFGLDSIADIYGNMGADTGWCFFVDTQKPKVEFSEDPVTYCYDSLVFNIKDTLSGISSASIRLSINEKSYSINDKGISWYNGQLKFNPKEVEPSIIFENGEIIISLTVSDSVRIGNPNELDTAWIKQVKLKGPRIEYYEPLDSYITSDLNQKLMFVLLPDSFEIEKDKIILSVEGIEYSLNSSEFQYFDYEYPAADIIIFQPSTPYFSGQWVDVSIQNIFDSNNTPLQTPLSFSFLVDKSFPIILDTNPYFGQAVADIQQDISFKLDDEFGFIDPDSIRLIVNNISFTLDSTCLLWDGSTLKFIPELSKSLTTFENNDSVYYTLSVYDHTDLGIPNPLLYNGYFEFISSNGPKLTNFAVVNKFISDSAFSIVMDFDKSINFQDASIMINNDIAHFYSGSAWNYSETTKILTYYPYQEGIFYKDGELLNIKIGIEIKNLVNNILQNPQEWTWHIDYSAPVISDLFPSPGTSTENKIDSVTAILIDSSGIILEESILFGISINGGSYDTLTIQDPALKFKNSLLTYKPPLGFSDGDEISVWIKVNDKIDFGQQHTGYVEWSFVISADAPQIEIIEPLDGIITSDSLQKVKIRISDRNGIDASTLRLLVNGSLNTIQDNNPALSFQGEILTYTPAEYIQDGTVTNLSLYPVADTYGHLSAIVKWSYFTDLNKSPGVKILEPLDNTISSSPIQPIKAVLSDPNGVNYASVKLFVNGRVFDNNHSAISIIADTLTFLPDISDAYVYNDNEQVNVCLESSDSKGNKGRECWSFRMDFSGPTATLMNPQQGGTANSFIPNITIGIEDLSGAIEPDSIVLMVEGIEYTLEDPMLTLEESSLIFKPYSGGISFSKGETVEISLHNSYDKVDYGYPNPQPEEQNWQFTISDDADGPDIQSISPSDGQVSTNTGPVLSFYVSDINGILDTTISITVQDSTYHFKENMKAFSLSKDTLRFYPDSVNLSFNNEEIVNVILHPLADQLDTYSLDSVSYFFRMDLGKPEIHSLFPANGDIISDNTPLISMTIVDNLAGINISELKINIANSIYTLNDPALSWKEDSILEFDCVDAGIYFNDNDTVQISLSSVYDNPENGSGNYASDTAWSFRVSNKGPEAKILYPFNNFHTTNSSKEVALIIKDINGINKSESEIVINGTNFLLNNPSFQYFTDTVKFKIDELGINITDTAHFRIESVFDNDNNAMDNPLDWFFIIDNLSPVAENPEPANLTSVTDKTPDISVFLIDSIGYIEPESIQFQINGALYTISDPALIWDEGSCKLIFSSSIAGLSFKDGDSINLSVTAYDHMDEGEPNELKNSIFSWTIGISDNGPVSMVINPIENVISSQSKIPVIIKLKDINGLDHSSISLTLEGVTYTLSDNSLIYYPEDDSLVFKPEFPYEEGEINFSLAASDKFGNPIDSVSDWSFFIDTSNPVAKNILPAPGSNVTISQPEISLILKDRIGRVDLNTIRLKINNYTHFDYANGLIWDNDSILSINPTVSGISFNDGETVTINLFVADVTDVGNVNTLDTTWTFTISMDGPSATIISPLPATYISDTLGPIDVNLSDPNGIDINSILVQVNDKSYRITDDPDVLSYSHLTKRLKFTPKQAYEEGKVNVIVYAADNGGISMDTTLEWSFIVDNSDPWAENPVPANNSVVSDLTPKISIGIRDEFGYVEQSSIQLKVNGQSYTDYFYVWDSNTKTGRVTFTPSDNFLNYSSVTVSVSAKDQNNHILIEDPYTWTFEIKLSGELYCKVSDPNGNLDSSKIVVMQNHSIVDTKYTNLSGEVWFSLPFGEYNVSISKSGYFASGGKVTITDGTVTQYICVLSIPGDFNKDGAVNSEDLDFLAQYWPNPVVEMYPYSGIIPDITINPDNVLDFEDLMVFVMVWNYHNQDKKMLSEYNALNLTEKIGISSLQIHSVSNDHEKYVTYRLSGENIKNYRSSRIIFKYDPDLLVFESAGKGDYFINNGINSLLLKTIDQANGIIEISEAAFENAAQNQSGILADLVFSKKSDLESDNTSAYYRIIDQLGNISTGNAREDKTFKPDSYLLRQNYPNPFSDETIFNYYLPEDAHVLLRVYDITGNLIDILVNESKQSGEHNYTWKTQHLNPGVYYYEIVTLNYTLTKSCIIY